MSLGNTADVKLETLEYRIDIAFLAHTEDERVLLIPYRRHPIVVFCRKDHRLARRRSIKLRDLEGEHMIVREQGSTTRRAFTAALGAAGVAPQIVMEIGSREAIREAVIHGIGISYVSDAEFVPDPSLVKINVEPGEIYTYAQLGILEKRRDSRIIKAFLDVVRKSWCSSCSARPAKAWTRAKDARTPLTPHLPNETPLCRPHHATEHLNQIVCNL